MYTSLPVLLTVILLVRHVPQIVIDLRNRQRKPIVVCHTWARSWMIQLLYLVVLIGCVVKIVGGNIPAPQLSWAGITILAIGAGLGLAGLLTLGSAYSLEIQISPEMHIVRNGIYAIVRHPQRLGLAVELIGLVLLAQTWWLVVPVLGVVYLQATRTTQEELFLCQHFGKKYENYCHEVPSVNLFAGIFRALGWLKLNSFGHR